MEDNRAEQKEALQALTEYSPKLIASMKAVVKELTEVRQPDTDEYLKSIINGMNWEIQILNGTMSLLNETEELVDKNAANQLFVGFSDVYKKGEDKVIAVYIQSKLLPFFEELENIAKNKINE